MVFADLFKQKITTDSVADTIMSHHEGLCQSLRPELAAISATVLNVDFESFTTMAHEAYCAHLAVWSFFFENAFSNEPLFLQTIHQIVEAHKRRSLKVGGSVDWATVLARGVSHLDFAQHQARLTLYLNVADNGCGALTNLGLVVPDYVHRKLAADRDGTFASTSPVYPISHVLLVAYHRCFSRMLRADTDTNWQVIDNAVYAYWFKWWVTLARLYQEARSRFVFRP